MLFCKKLYSLVYIDPDSSDSDLEANNIPALPDLMSRDKSVEYSDSIPRQQNRTYAENIFIATQGPPTRVASKFYSPFSCLKLFLEDSVVKVIVESTNHHLTSIDADWRLTSDDFWLWVGCLYYYGVMKGKNMCAETAFNKKFGLPFLSECN